jgi:superfamily II DNA/RNA helicase
VDACKPLGSGKTFAYTLPMVASIGAPGRGGTKIQGRCCPAMIVLVPNVELGRQAGHGRLTVY